MYTHQVNYSKRFQSGMFEGKLYHAHAKFADLASAKKFKKLCESGHTFKACAGVSDYKAEDVSHIIELE